MTSSALSKLLDGLLHHVGPPPEAPFAKRQTLIGHRDRPCCRRYIDFLLAPRRSWSACMPNIQEFCDSLKTDSLQEQRLCQQLQRNCSRQKATPAKKKIHMQLETASRQILTWSKHCVEFPPISAKPSMQLMQLQHTTNCYHKQPHTTLSTTKSIIQTTQQVTSRMTIRLTAGFGLMATQMQPQAMYPLASCACSHLILSV